MRTNRTIVVLALTTLLASSPLWSQNADSNSQIEQLKSLVGAQQKALEQQQSEIHKLQSDLEEQQKLLIGVVQTSPNNPKYMPAVDRTVDMRASDSGVYAQKNATVNTDGTCCVGWGYPGASSNADRLIEEITGGYSRVIWKHEDLGSVQWGAQYAFVWLDPWVQGSGPSNAHTNMVFFQMRYNMP